MLIFLGVCYNFNVIGQSWQWVQMETPDTSAESLQDGKLFGDTAVIMGGYGKTFYTTDFFQTYRVDTTYYGNAFGAMEFINSDTGYIETNVVGGGLLISTDGGISFRPFRNGLPTGFGGGSALQFSMGDTAYMASSEGDFAYRVGMNAHRGYPIIPSLSISRGIVQIRVTNDSTIYMLTSDQAIPDNGGELYLIRSSNYGNTWEYVGKPDLYGNGDFRILDDSTIIIAGAYGIAKSTNGGDSFHIVMHSNNLNDLIDICMRSVYFVNHDTGFVAFETSVYRTYDAGDTWVKTDFAFDSNSLTSYIEFITATSSQKVIVGCAYGEIYKTSNGGGIATDVTNVYPQPTFTLSPNPTTGPLKITPPTTTGANYNIEVTNLLGQTVYKTYVINNQINISNLAPGMYLLNLEVNGAYQTAKFVKQ